MLQIVYVKSNMLFLVNFEMEVIIMYVKLKQRLYYFIKYYFFKQIFQWGYVFKKQFYLI